MNASRIPYEFSNIGQDEDGNAIGNCKGCGSHGVLIGSHRCPTDDDSPYLTSRELGMIESSLNETWNNAAQRIDSREVGDIEKEQLRAIMTNTKKLLEKVSGLIYKDTITLKNYSFEVNLFRRLLRRKHKRWKGPC